MRKLYGIGVGPGSAELLTLKACRLLNRADVIFCPEKSEGAGSFAFEIVKEVLEHDRAQVVPLTYPMHDHGEKLKDQWRENGKRIARLLEGEKTGVFLTLGDASIYSTLMYTLPYIEEEGVEVEMVPGVTSFCAAANRIKLPLMAGGENLLIAPVRKNGQEELGKLLADHDNLVLMKPGTDREALLQAIRQNGLEDRFALVIKAGTEEERVITDFSELERTEFPYLSTMIIKKRGIAPFQERESRHS